MICTEAYSQVMLFFRIVVMTPSAHRPCSTNIYTATRLCCVHESLGFHEAVCVLYEECINVSPLRILDELRLMQLDKSLPCYFEIVMFAWICLCYQMISKLMYKRGFTVCAIVCTPLDNERLFLGSGLKHFNKEFLRLRSSMFKPKISSFNSIILSDHFFICASDVVQLFPSNDISFDILNE